MEGDPKMTEQKNADTCNCYSVEYQDKFCECSDAEIFLKLADEAWMEVLKEKIKVEIEKNKAA